MIKKMVTLLGIAFPLMVQAQALTIEDCRQMAHDNYPAIRQYKLIEQLRDYTVENAAKGWLPQIGISAGAYAFTDILSANEQMKAMGIDMKNYMVNGAVSVKQNIYDGGQISAGKQTAKAQAEVEKHRLEVSMYEVNDRVEQLFFGVLMADEQLKQNELLQSDLGASEKTLRSMVTNGTATQSDHDAIRVEQIKALQQQDALKETRAAYLRMLSIFIGKTLDGNIVLNKPSEKKIGLTENNRPELAFYSSSERRIEADRKQLNSRLKPTIGLFGTGAWHTQVSDMINQGILFGGISVSWNLGALYTRKNDLRKLEVQREQNNSQRDVFLFNNRLQNEDTNGTIRALRQQIERDEEIVELRESIRSAGEKKVMQGTESANELVRDINAVSMARQAQALHEIQLLKALYHLRYLNNN